MKPLVAFLLAFAPQEPAPVPRDEIVERELARIEYALVALRNAGEDAALRERAVQAIEQAVTALRALRASRARAEGTPEPFDLPEGPWVDPALVGARPPFARVLEYDFGHDPHKEGWYTLESVDLAGRQRGVGVVQSHYHGTDGRPLAWTNVRVRGALDSDGAPRSRWGVIAFDVEGWSFVRCTFRDIPDEHGLYLTTLGGFRFERCLFAEIGSQAIQIVGAVPGTPREVQTAHRADWRAYSSARAGETHLVSECVFLEVGKPTGGRPSYAISAFEGPRNPLRVERSVLRTTRSVRIDGSGFERDCFGAVMAHQRNRFELVDTYIEYPRGDRDVVQVWHCSDGKPGTPDVVITGSRVIANTFVDVRVSEGDTVVVEGNSGSTARLRVSTNPPDTWPGRPGWDPARILYEGPLTD
ncbi:MAG TPA: hypothetical protein VMT18_00375, partial [Planctomycetota bacterium]|nr:hypothetical protein [Planctomycetota bacterium]